MTFDYEELVMNSHAMAWAIRINKHKSNASSWRGSNPTIRASPGKRAKNKTRPYKNGTVQLFLLNAPFGFAVRITWIKRLENVIPAPAAMMKTNCQMKASVAPICAPMLINAGIKNEAYTPPARRRVASFAIHSGLDFTTDHHKPTSVKQVAAVTA